ncbi:MAG: DegT/DnrJ/EryC1/StrS family aminotransferase [Verrucomicrobiota bacterium]
MQIPFVSLRIESESLQAEIQEAIQEVIRSGAFAGGPFVAAFEADFAAYCQCEFASGLGNGTDALWLALLALGVGPDDEVITAPNSFFATAEAISLCGAKPVFVDVDPQTYTIDPTKIEPAITPRTKAIIPVHLFGQTADMDPILALAKRRGLFVVEDACQAHGATYKGRRAGSLGNAGCFSFYPTKNLGAFGEAGAVVTNDRRLKERVDCLRDHGQSARYQHQLVGWNGRMDGIQGAVLRAKLRHLSRENELRRSHAADYRRRLHSVKGVHLPFEAEHAHHVYHLFVIKAPGARAELMQHLAARGIGCQIHYPTPIHLQPAYSSLNLPVGSFPVAEQSVKEFISLPMFPALQPEAVGKVSQEISAFFGPPQSRV